VPLPLMQRLRQGRGLGPLWHVAYAPECTITQPPPPSASQSVGQSVRRSVGRQSIGQSDSLSVNICQPVGQPASQRPPLPLRPPPSSKGLRGGPVRRAQRWPGSEGGRSSEGPADSEAPPEARTLYPVPCTLTGSEGPVYFRFRSAPRSAACACRVRAARMGPVLAGRLVVAGR